MELGTVVLDRGRGQRVHDADYIPHTLHYSCFANVSRILVLFRLRYHAKHG